MDSTVLYPQEVKTSKLRYSNVKTLDSGARMVYVNYGDEKLTIQTPLVVLPYGVTDNDSFNAKDAAGRGGAAAAAAGPKRYDLTISFRGMDENKKVKAFHDKMLEIEKKIAEDAFANRLAWLRDDFEGMQSVVTKLMNPIIRVDKDKQTGKPVGKYPPTMKIKLPYDMNVDDFVFDAVDMDNNHIDFKSVMTKLKGTKAILAIQLTGLYFAGGKYGCMWKVITGMFQRASERRKAALRPDSDVEDNAKGESDDQELEEEAVARADAGGATPVKKAVVQSRAPTKVEVSESEDEADADNEEEADADEAEEDEPAPPPKKGAKAAPPPPPPVEESEEEEVIEESDDEPAPPPPPKRKTATTAAKKK